ncbi:MAG: hypothetical protein COB78_07220 [Hyphomicrobiales bacterium]|nr:MAG: hypothetical protein COB78_07220 [Hyphomicrobiales bacterium]
MAPGNRSLVQLIKKWLQSNPQTFLSFQMSRKFRPLDLLSLFSIKRPFLSADEIAELSHVPISTVYRQMKTLRELGMIEALDRERYRLGGAVSVLDRIAREADPLLKAARPVMVRLCKKTKHTVTLTRLFKTDLISVSQELGRAPIRVGYERGEIVPLFYGCTGKITLAHMEWRALKTLFKGNAQQISAAGLGADWKAFLSTLRDFRSAPYLWTEGEITPENVAVASPILDEAGRVMGALTVIMPKSNRPSGIDDKIAIELQAAVEEVSKNLVV